MPSIKLKMLTGLSGPNYSLSPGDEHEFAEYEAKRLVEAGFAEFVETEAQREERLKADAAAAEAKAKAEADAAAETEEKALADAAAAAAAEAEAKEKADANAAAAKEAEAKAQAEADAAAAGASFPDLATARKAYKAAFDKNPAPNWSIEVIAEKIAAKPVEA